MTLLWNKTPLILVKVSEKPSAYISTYSEKRVRRFLLHGRHLPYYMTSHQGNKFYSDNAGGAGVKLRTENIIFFAVVQNSAKHGRALRPFIGYTFHNQLP